MARKWLIFSILLYLIAFILLFPCYRYILDVDATGYINAAKQLAAGNIQHGINGFWSPLSSWILVPFIKLGLDPVLTCKFINAVLAVLTLIAMNAFAGKVMMEDKIKRVVLFTAIPILLYFTFFELCADFLLVCLLLIYLNLITAKDFKHSTPKLVLCAIISALAYYAKNYALYFIAIHFTLSLFILMKGEMKWRLQFLKRWLIFMLVLLMLIVPWWLILSNKYGRFTTGNAGRSNFAWQLIPLQDQQRVLITPPSYPGGSSDWDDPTYKGDHKISPFSNQETFMHQLTIVGYNIKELGKIWLKFSIFSIIILLMAFYYLWFRGFAFKDFRNHKILILFICILPLGYLPLIIQPRYIWATEIGLLFLGGILTTAFYAINRLAMKTMLIVQILVCASFIYYPISVLWEKRNKGVEEHQIAKMLAENNIHGKMMSNWKESAFKSRSQVICFLNGDQWYGPGTADFSDDEILQAIKDNHIDYYIFYFNNDIEKQRVINSSIMKASSRDYGEIYRGIWVLGFK